MISPKLIKIHFNSTSKKKKISSQRLSLFKEKSIKIDTKLKRPSNQLCGFPIAKGSISKTSLPLT